MMGRRAKTSAPAVSPQLEATYSPEQVADHFGVSVREVRRLVALGTKYGADLHPTRGGLHPTFRVSHKVRRITAGAIERHKEHQRRVALLRPLPSFAGSIEFATAV
jgi:transposase